MSPVKSPVLAVLKSTGVIGHDTWYHSIQGQGKFAPLNMATAPPRSRLHQLEIILDEDRE